MSESKTVILKKVKKIGDTDLPLLLQSLLIPYSAFGFSI